MCAFVGLGSMAFIVSPLCTGLKSVCFSLAGFRQRHTVPVGLGTVMNLLHHSAVSSTPIRYPPILWYVGVVIVCNTTFLSIKLCNSTIVVLGLML